jgi:cell division protein ZapE
LKNFFLQYCLDNKFQQNNAQIKSLELLTNFIRPDLSKNIILKLFTQPDKKLGFYLHGDVGVGKTMLLNFFFDQLDLPKKRMHFNEFMINFHDFRHTNKLQDKDNSISIFVKNLKKKINLLYLDEFQVTNIVDAMILGKLFEFIFKEKIKVLISSNIKINNLYDDGLQREQFIPFIKIIKKFCIEHELSINQDYRKIGKSKLERFFFPLNEQTSFQVSQIFRQLSKGKKESNVQLKIKGRTFSINSFFEGHVRFDFNDLCATNLGAEDYITISNKCNFITLVNIPNFTEENVNLQQRFITLIDILYEKKIPMMISANFNLDNFTSSKKLLDPYRRTMSRLFELTSANFYNQQ